MNTDPQRDLADFCEWLPDGSRQPCYAPTSFVLIRPSGDTLRFTCAAHLPLWAGRVQGKYAVLSREEWKARGSGYRGKMLGG